MKRTNMKRYFGTERPVEESDKEPLSAEHSNGSEQALDLKKVRKAEEFRLSHLPPLPVYGRPDCCDVTHRFGKRTGST
jgi:hypothetical protein